MKNAYVIVLLAFVFNSVFADEAPDYNNANGTIFYQKENSKTKEVIRQCNVEVEIGNLAEPDQRVIYESYTSQKVIGYLHDYDKVKVIQIYRIDFLNKKKNRWGDISGELWFKIIYSNITGWICISSDYIGDLTDPYYNNRWCIIEKISKAGKLWTVRSMDQGISFWGNLNIRDNPGTSGTKIIDTIRPDQIDSTQIYVQIIAMTEEVEVIDDIEDHWLKIKYKDYIGWIFGGPASAERGGPKYWIPEIRIEYHLGWY